MRLPTNDYKDEVILDDFIEGLQIIKELRLRLSLDFQKDGVLCGHYSQTPEEEGKRLRQLGWTADLDKDKWIYWIA